MSNVKQSSLATLQYIQDYDEHFPPSAQWMTKIAPYIKGDDAFHCPEAVDRSHLFACGYAFDSRLSSAALSNIYAPATSLMIFESLDLRRNASDKCTSLPDFNHRRHSQDNVGLCDGHVRGFWRGEDIANLGQDPFARQKPLPK